jgi:hypothetical protein
MEYKIEISMTPHVHDNPLQPYFWCILYLHGKQWCNSGHGWAVTPEEAWKEAKTFYNKYLRERKT